jgi:hypothetical protein
MSFWEKLKESKYKYIIGVMLIILSFGFFATLVYHPVPMANKSAIDQFAGGLQVVLGIMIRDIFKSETTKPV